MQALKEFSKKEMYELDDKDVLDYLMFKDVNDSGRTIIHHHACPRVKFLLSEVTLLSDIVHNTYRLQKRYILRTVSQVENSPLHKRTYWVLF